MTQMSIEYTLLEWLGFDPDNIQTARIDIAFGRPMRITAVHLVTDACGELVIRNDKIATEVREYEMQPVGGSTAYWEGEGGSKVN